MTSKCNKLTNRAALLLSAAFAFAAPAAATILNGTVADGTSQSFLPGARVHIEGTDVTVSTDRSGRFTIPNLKAGNYRIHIEYVGYGETVQSIYIGNQDVATVGLAISPETKIETVVITGERQAERIALQTKKISDNFIDALSANDVGKLPDQNVAEAVRRMPGISVANDQGEGRYVIIRGVAPDLANVTINGATAPAPEPDGRQVKLDDIPASLISSLQVVKTLTPDMDANAIAGAVNINTLSAYDRPDPFAYGRVSMGHYQMNGQSPYEGDLTVGRVFGDGDQYGMVLSANYSRRDIESENFGAGGPDWTSYNGHTSPSTMQLRDYNLVRKRSGLVANFDWHPTAGTKIYWRSTYSTYSDEETRDRFTVTLPTSASSYTSQTATTGSFSGATANRYVRSRTESDHTINSSLGGSTLLGGGELSAEVSYGHAVKIDPRRNEYIFKASKITGTYDLSDFLYMVTPSDTAYTASKFAINKIQLGHRKAVEDLYQAHADYLLPLEFLGDGEDSIKFGFKYTGRDKTNDVTTITLKPTSSTMTLANVATTGKTTIFDGRYNFGPRVSYDAARTYVLSAHGTLDCDDTTTGGFKCDKATSISDSLSADYDISERILSGYAMATLKMGGLTLIPGVRVEATDGTYKGKSYTDTSTFDEGFNVVSKRSYTDLFPGLNAHYEIDDALSLRAAVTTAIGRPNYQDLAPYIVVDTSTPEVTEGNADLKPLHSTNLDTAIEYYLPHQGLVSFGAFYKHIKNPIYTQSLYNVSGSFAGQSLTGATVTKPLNADEAEIRGFELSAQMQFDFLPSPLDGFGMNTSFAYIDSAAKGLSERSGHVPMFNQSKNVASLQLLYEKYGVAGRLAYSYRSKFLDTVGNDKMTDVYEDAHGQLDARLSYQLTELANVYIDASNLTDAPWRRFIGVSNHAYEYEHYGWALSGGIQFKL